MMDSVKKAFVLSVKALKLFYVLAAVNIIVNIINLFVIPAPVNVAMTLARSFAVIGLTILFILVSVFVYAGALAHIKELIKTGAANITSFVDSGKKYFLRLLGISALLLLVYLGAGIILFGILALLPQVLKPLMIGIITLVFIALAVLFIMPSYALIASDVSVMESIKKGVIVGKKNFLKILGILAIMVVVAIAIMIIASLVSGILSFILRPIPNLVAAIVMALANAVLTILVSIAYMDFYLKNSEQGA